MYNILIFDVYNVFHRVFFGNENLTKVGDKLIPIDAICKYFELCNSYIDKYGLKKDCIIYWLMDNAKSAMVFSVTVFPPVFGPVIMRTRFPPIKLMSTGTAFSPNTG